jgi:SNF family Na+-dependent transporter
MISLFFSTLLNLFCNLILQINHSLTWFICMVFSGFSSYIGLKKFLNKSDQINEDDDDDLDISEIV